MDNKDNFNIESCGCGHDHDHEEMEVIVLTLDDDTELECGILGVFEVPAEEKEYMALVSLDDNQVLLYRYIEDAEESEVFELASIETDEEFDNVSEIFHEIFSDEDEEELE